MGGKGALPLSPAFGDRVGSTVPDLSPMPTVNYCKHGPGCPEHTIRADYPETPELAELREIQATQGMDAATERYKQQQRNQRRRRIVTSRKRYAAIALEKNMRLAAERLAEQKLAEKKPPSSVSADTQHPNQSPNQRGAKSYGLTWIAISCYKINKLRTIHG